MRTMLEPPHLLVVATVVIGRGCGLLKTLIALLPVTLGVLHSVLDGIVRQHLPIVAQGWAKLGCLVAGRILGGDTMQLLGGVPENIGQYPANA
jgi:hypothetical protein